MRKLDGRIVELSYEQLQWINGVSFDNPVIHPCAMYEAWA